MVLILLMHTIDIVLCSAVIDPVFPIADTGIAIGLCKTEIIKYITKTFI